MARWHFLTRITGEFRTLFTRLQSLVDGRDDAAPDFCWSASSGRAVTGSNTTQSQNPTRQATFTVQNTGIVAHKATQHQERTSIIAEWSVFLLIPLSKPTAVKWSPDPIDYIKRQCSFRLVSNYVSRNASNEGHLLLPCITEMMITRRSCGDCYFCREIEAPSDGIPILILGLRRHDKIYKAVTLDFARYRPWICRNGF